MPWKSAPLLCTSLCMAWLAGCQQPAPKTPSAQASSAAPSEESTTAPVPRLFATRTPDCGADDGGGYTYLIHAGEVPCQVRKPAMYVVQSCCGYEQATFAFNDTQEFQNVPLCTPGEDMSLMLDEREPQACPQTGSWIERPNTRSPLLKWHIERPGQPPLDGEAEVLDCPEIPVPGGCG